MNRLIKRGNYYYFSLNTPTGRKLITTKCTEYNEAVRVVKSSGMDKMSDVAKSIRLTHQSISYLISGEKVTMSKAVKQYVEWLSITQSHIYAEECGIKVMAFARFCGIENGPVASVTEKEIDAFINDPKSSRSASTRKSLLKHLRCFMAYCLNNGWCFRKPAELVVVNHRILTHTQKEKREQTPYTEDEAREIVRLCREAILKCPTHTKAKGQYRRQRMQFWQAAVTISWHTGLRLADVANLEWESLKDPGVIIVHTAKTDKRVELEPANRPEIDAAIALLPKEDERYVFPRYSEMARRAESRSFLPKDFSRLCAEFGVVYRGFHSFRRGHATARAKAGESLEAIAKDLGHSDVKTTAGYVL